MKNKALVYSGWLQIMLAVAAVFALRWQNSESGNSEFFLEFWWVWPAALLLIIMGASTIIRNRR